MPNVKKSKAKRKAVKKKKEEEEFWSDEDELEDDMMNDAREEVEDIDVSKLKFTKLKDLEVGMEDVNIEATIDFVGEIRGKEYGDAPFALGFLKDKTGEVKITFWGDDSAIAKHGMKIQVLKCGVGQYRGQLQIYPHKALGVTFITPIKKTPVKKKA